MKKIIGLAFLFILAGVNTGYAQKIDILLEYTQPIAANSKKSFTIDIRGKGYTEVKIRCTVDRRDVVMYYKTNEMNDYTSVSATPLPVLYRYYYHRKLFSVSASLAVKTAGSIHFIVKNKSNKDTSVRLTVNGIIQE